jgi:hypothetical protein
MNEPRSGFSPSITRAEIIGFVGPKGVSISNLKTNVGEGGREFRIPNSYFIRVRPSPAMQ